MKTFALFFFLIWLIAILAGCAIAPNTAHVELTHTSHLTQHAPFTSDPTSYGYSALQVGARWQKKGFYVEVNEGVTLNRRDGDSVGGLWGREREEFTGRVGYQFQVKP